MIEQKVNKVSIIEGEKHTDARGTINFFNGFNLAPVKRQYILEHPNTGIIRAWQGHRHEHKWFQVIAGGFKIAVIQPDDWKNPSEDLPVQEFDVTAIDNFILHVPGGYATGFKATLPDSRLLVFSNFSVAESVADDVRFPAELWYNW